MKVTDIDDVQLSDGNSIESEDDGNECEIDGSYSDLKFSSDTCIMKLKSPDENLDDDYIESQDDNNACEIGDSDLERGSDVREFKPQDENLDVTFDDDKSMESQDGGDECEIGDSDSDLQLSGDIRELKPQDVRFGDDKSMESQDGEYQCEIGDSYSDLQLSGDIRELESQAENLAVQFSDDNSVESQDGDNECEVDDSDLKLSGDILEVKSHDDSVEKIDLPDGQVDIDDNVGCTKKQGNSQSAKEKLLVFPKTRVKAIIKLNEDIGLINNDSMAIINKATEYFIQEIVKGASYFANAANKKTVTRIHLEEYFSVNTQLEFLDGMLDSA